MKRDEEAGGDAVDGGPVSNEAMDVDENEAGGEQDAGENEETAERHATEEPNTADDVEMRSVGGDSRQADDAEPPKAGTRWIRVWKIGRMRPRRMRLRMRTKLRGEDDDNPEADAESEQIEEGDGGEEGGEAEHGDGTRNSQKLFFFLFII